MTPKQQAKRQRQCGHKVRHRTAEDGRGRQRTAEEAGVHAESLYQATGCWANVYECFWGSVPHWHVGGGH